MVSKTDIIMKLMELLRKNAEFTVIRGAVLWNTFSWPTKFAVSVRIPESYPSRSSDGLRTIVVEAEGLTKIPESSEEDASKTLDELENHILDCFKALRLTTKSNGDAIILNSEHVGSLELSDLNLKVQGLSITFTLEF